MLPVLVRPLTVEFEHSVWVPVMSRCKVPYLQIIPKNNFLKSPNFFFSVFQFSTVIRINSISRIIGWQQVCCTLEQCGMKCTIRDKQYGREIVSSNKRVPCKEKSNSRNQNVCRAKSYALHNYIRQNGASQRRKKNRNQF